ncbi:hypothetical protein BJY04DRAFT_228699 [Aspergillus karnatakaensis]|uniref:uncharacterized protein n=1 Tax=Aspergillus karnatakaensis TaxID=1810916 RepID=UPI003CCE1B78
MAVFLEYGALLVFFLQLAHSKRGGPSVDILVSPDEQDGVTRAAKDLALDFGRVVGVNGTVRQNITLSRHRDSVPVIVGTVGSSFIDQLVKDNKIDVSEIKGQWESYAQAVVRDPFPGIPHALVIAGSDKRGTIYGIYDISETIGVSPWYFWADVPIKTKAAIYLNPGDSRVHGPPSVKYRGIFINDEWELFEWTDGRFPQSPLGDHFTSEFYALVFELLLRLKANYLWPGMKKKNSFYLDDPQNGVLADEYGIVMGTSHHEPMTRSYYEQGRIDGNWDWSLNREEVKQFMDEGVERSKNWETLYTMGMRGEGDRESPTLDSAQLEEIIELQQGMIDDIVPRPLEQVGQTWSLYKEVGKYWQAGMNISELVTLMWTDDNFGNLLRVPLANETTRSGGAGVYYHFGYVGSPRSYEWINTNQLVKVWEQMHYAYEREARNIWIANCNDIKSLEVPTTLFLDMAYDMAPFQTPDSPTRWLKLWARKEFGAKVEEATAEILNRYGQLVLRRKYELYSMSPFAFSTLNYDEASNILGDWEDLLAFAQETYDSLDSSIQGSYFQLVLHPVLAGKTVTELYIAKHLGDLYKAQLRTSTNKLAQKAQQAFAKDAAITSRYHALFDGKWDGMMSGIHIGYIGRTWPSHNIMPNISWIGDGDVSNFDILGVAAQGLNTSSIGNEPINLPLVDPYMPPAETRYLDIFTRTNGTLKYKIETNVSYVSTSSSKGTLTAPGENSDVRSKIKVNWEKAPSGLSWASVTVFDTQSNSTVQALLPVNKTSINSRTPKRFTGHVESNGIVSIEPIHYASAERTKEASYINLPYYGRTYSGIKLWPVTAPSQSSLNGPKLTYPFYSFSKAKARLILFLGGTLDLDPTRPLRVAFSIDSNQAITQRVLPDYEAGSLPKDWDTAVIWGGWNVTADLDVEMKSGEHTLNLWLLEPGVVVQKILIDFGGLKESALGPPESLYIKGH